MNNVSLVGRITKDLELKETQNAKKYIFFTLAVNRMKADEADFIACTAWENTAENMVKYLTKGSQIGITGNITTGSYQKNGETIYTTGISVFRVEFLDSKNGIEKPKSAKQENNYDNYFADIDNL